MKVLMFQPQFATKVALGEKCQTIRPVRKVPIKVGDELSLRAWKGKPYASKQRVLRQATVRSVDEIDIRENGAWFGNSPLRSSENWNMAWADGFKSPVEMRDWFRKTHGLPFHGTLIRWDQIP